MSLIQFTKELTKIAFIGLAKNTGKTVAMQSLINEINSIGIKYGVTSIGHDGEKFDQTNYLIRKPSIFLHTGSIVSTTDKLLIEAKAKTEIIYKTKYYTPLGRVFISRMLESGDIEVAGPSTTTGIADVSDKMLELGVEKVLIDGAINRKAIANPELSNGIFLATGAVISPLIRDIVKETNAAIQAFTLPIENIDLSLLNIDSQFSYLIDTENKKVVSIPGSLLNQMARLENTFKNYGLHDFLMFRSVTEKFLDFLLVMMKKHGKSNLRLIIHDHTKLFLENKSVKYYTKKGLTIHVMNPVNILAVTVNPVAPLAHAYESEQLVSEIQKNLPSIPVIDVLNPLMIS
jgi:hypothetical protein